MNGFKFLAVGAFLYCGPSFCYAQINLLDRAQPRPVLIKAVQEDSFPSANAADLARQVTADAEVSSNTIENPFPGANPSPSDSFVDTAAEPVPNSDPSSLPVGTRHRQNPVDQILRNGLISQTPNASQVPISWPMQGAANPTARMMLNTDCTQGLWDSYPAERAAECALMHQRLAGEQRSHRCSAQGCSAQGCGAHGHLRGCQQSGWPTSGPAHFQPVNRCAPRVCDTMPAANSASAIPQYQRLVAPVPTPLAEEATENQDHVAQLPGLFR